MDNKQLRKFFRRKLAEHEDSGAYEGGWSRLSGQLEGVHALRPRHVVWREWLADHSSHLLLVAVLLLTGWGIYQQYQMGQLLEALRIKPIERLVVQRDTIYLRAAETGLVAAERYRQRNTYAWESASRIPQTSFTTLQFSNLLPSPTEANNNLKENESIFPANLIEAAIMDAEQVAAIPSSDTANQITGLSETQGFQSPPPDSGDTTYLPLADTLFADQPVVPDTLSPRTTAERKPPKRMRNPLSIHQRAGASFALPLMLFPYAAPNLSFGIGLRYEVLLGSRFALGTGLQTAQYAYRIRQIQSISRPGLDLNSFPELAQIENFEHLDKIESENTVLEIPFYGTWYLPAIGKYRPTIEAGILVQKPIHQEYSYEYNDVQGISYSKEVKGSPLELGSVSIAPGLEFPISGSTWLRTQIFYQRNLNPMGPEGARFHSTGARVSVLFQWDK